MDRYLSGLVRLAVAETTTQGRQGHHHSGDQAARRPHMISSICGRRFTPLCMGVLGDRDELIR